MKRTAEATWNGDLQSGKGVVSSDSKVLDNAQYSFKTRFEDGKGTNPEELIAAAHAGCFAMALSHELATAGHAPESVHAKATVRLDKVEGGFAIGNIHLTVTAKAPGLDKATFDKFAAGAKAGCPISKALAAVEITMDATLEG